MGSSFGSLVLIVNPHAGRGRVARELPAVERALRLGGFDYRIERTRAPGEATDLARAALASGDRFLVAVGGDGTVHEVINGMFDAGSDRPLHPDAVLGVVAAGSGSDFVRTFGLPEDATRASACLQGTNLYRIDLGKVTFLAPSGHQAVRYFANIAEAGLGGAVTARAARLPKRLGRAKYFLGFWLTLPAFRATEVTVQAGHRTSRGPAFNVVVANCQFYGGGMKISPRSWPSDGYLDVLVMNGAKSDSFTILPKVYRGEHLPHPGIQELRAASVRVHAARPLDVEADGEVLGTTPASFEVLPEALALKI